MPDIYPTVADLLADPARWCQGAIARDAAGNVVNPENPSACRWCAAGAVERVYAGRPGFSAAMLALRNAVGGRLTGWNDDPARTHLEVMEAVRRAGI